MNNKYIILLIATMSMTFSCSDFLEEDAKGLITPDQFYTNEAEANLALNGLQSRMTNRYAGGQDILFYETLGTDQGVQGRNGFVGSLLFATYDLTPSEGVILNIWQQLYAGIRDANLAISRVEQSASLSDEVKTNIISQAYFFRAYFYYRLTTMWGDVPYWTDELDIDAVSLLGKTSATTIQDNMIADLETAINSGSLSKGRWNQSGGRITEWAARMMKAHYHMWKGEYPEARTELIEVTANSPHTTLGAYGDIYRSGNDLNDETIYAIEFLAGIISSDFHNASRPNGGGESSAANASAAFKELNIQTRAATLTLRESMANTYDPTDLRLPYNVFENYTLNNGTFADFNFVYIPKFMRAPVPVSDPLFPIPEADGQSGAPTRLMLLADAYLMLAEAEFMIGGSNTSSLAAINTVRDRAGLDDLTTLTLQDIQNERSWEFAGEGMGRKTDLIRWGILEDVVLALPAKERAAGAHANSIERADLQAAAISSAPSGKYNFLPIPFDEITKSKDLGGALTQNPLWE